MTYSPSDDMEVMLTSRVRSVGLDNNGKLVQRWNKINSGGEMEMLQEGATHCKRIASKLLVK